MKISIFFATIIAIASLIFAFQNNEFVTVKYFTYTFDGSLALIIISALILGFLVGVILLAPANFVNRWKIKKLEKQVGKLDKRVEEEVAITFDTDNGEHIDASEEN